MNSSLERALSNFGNSISSGKIVVDGQTTEVEVLFTRHHMEIRNLQELPPYIRLPVASQDFHSSNEVLSNAQFSHDNQEWKNFDDETAEYLQIYRILHPLIIIPRTEFKDHNIDPLYNEVEKFVGFYNIADIRLPTKVISFFLEYHEEIRPIEVIIFGKRIIEIKQKEIPPSTENISITFTGIAAVT